MKIDDRRPGKGFKTVRYLKYGEVFEYENKIYMKVRGDNARVQMKINGLMDHQTMCVCTNLKSGTSRPIDPDEVVQQVHGRVVIERNG